MEYKDYYTILGVEKNATPEEIKKQYRRLARKYHPDVSEEKDAEEKFKEVKEAYEVLSDPEKRKAFEQLGSQGVHGSPFNAPPGWEFNQARAGGSEQFDGADFSEFFENMFGQRGRGAGRHHTGSHRGEDQYSKIMLSLEEAFSGAERVLQLQEPVIDPATREVKYTTRSLKVKIPAGVKEGQHIRLSKQGTKGIGTGVNGDLYLEIHLKDHPLYTLKERDIYLNLPITPWEAALGAKIAVPTLAGKVELKIPAASQTGNTLRLKGRGLPGKHPGDQYVALTIYTPEPKTDNQRQLYEKMAEEMPYDPRAALMQ